MLHNHLYPIPQREPLIEITRNRRLALDMPSGISKGMAGSPT
jgi:hypothetical protein